MPDRYITLSAKRGMGTLF